MNVAVTVNPKCGGPPSHEGVCCPHFSGEELGTQLCSAFTSPGSGQGLSCVRLSMTFLNAQCYQIFPETAT